jgi:cysteinyl-tRNA synthetase
MYLCGMTVQDQPHVGHMRSAIAGDVIRRYFEHLGFEVTFVYNFTDVDDRIIARGNDEGVAFERISDRNIEAFLSSAKKLNVRPATHYPRATEHIAEILAMIGALIERGFAYAAGGDVYFRVNRFDEYGKLSGRRTDDLLVGARIAPGEHKEDPLDFTLWKGAKPGEPSWESPWGPGRPGWHIECSAMAKRYLGETFDIHAGGNDLIFPHHENEIAQSECANGKPFVNYWMHNGMVNLTGEKMSKSTKHFFSAEEILAEYEAPVLRFYLMSTHYRSPIEFNRERLDEAFQAVQRLRHAARESAALRERIAGDARPDGDLGESMQRLSEGFHEAMRDDFNSAKALGFLFEMTREVNKELDAAASDPAREGRAAEAARLMLIHADILGLDLETVEDRAIPAEIQNLFEERQHARATKNWALADGIRADLLTQGYAIEDRADGSRVVRVR